VIDSGLGVSEAEDLLSVCGEYVDIVKFGWGTGYVTGRLEEKIDMYQEHDVEVYFGGTLFEISVLQNKLDEFTRCMKELGVNHIEVSTGVITIDHERKCDLIDRLSDDFTVFSEVGIKDYERSISGEEWVSRSEKELDAGAWKIITEGRASGKTGIYQGDGQVKDEIIDMITAEIDESDLMFEAPNKEQQVWFIEKLGPSVNLGNIEMRDVVSLETLRLGLRGDTMKTIHGDTA
jgi:phosphosulfolactate synthase